MLIIMLSLENDKTKKPIAYYHTSSNNMLLKESKERFYEECKRILQASEVAAYLTHSPKMERSVELPMGNTTVYIIMLQDGIFVGMKKRKAD